MCPMSHRKVTRHECGHGGGSMIRTVNEIFADMHPFRLKKINELVKNTRWNCDLNAMPYDRIIIILTVTGLERKAFRKQTATPRIGLYGKTVLDSWGVEPT